MCVGRVEAEGSVCVCAQLRGVRSYVCLTQGVWAGNVALDTVTISVCVCV